MNSDALLIGFLAFVFAGGGKVIGYFLVKFGEAAYRKYIHRSSI